MKTPFTVLLTLLISFAYGQDKAYKELTRFLKANEIDTFMIVKSGCSTCIISYEKPDRIGSAGTATIKLVYQKKGKNALVIFSDTSRPKAIANIETNIFEIIADNRQVLRAKDKYYQEQKLAKFQAPCLVTFPYETIELKYGQFKHIHTLVKRETDDCGTTLTNEDWFRVEVEVLEWIDKMIM